MALQAKMAINEAGERVIKISFPSDFNLLRKVRSLPGRKYYPDKFVWTCPLTPQAVESLKSWDFKLDTPLLEYRLRADKRRREIIIDGIPGLKGTLYPFQNEGVAFIELNEGRALIADEMGLGKTIQALAWVQLHPEYRPAIIITPASLKLNWKKECLMWMSDPKVEILSGNAPWYPNKINDILIINYDVLPAWLPILRSKKAKVIITDECHYYKSNATKRTKALKKLVKLVPYFIALSGTPVLNRPIEIYNAVKIIKPDLFPTYEEFAERYCNGHNNGFRYDVNGATNIKELHDILKSSVMIRRLKMDVLNELPEKLYSFVPIELDNVKDYNAAERDFISFIRKEKGVEAAKRASNAVVLSSIEGLKQLAVKGKLAKSIEWIKNFLDIDGKLVVFATHKFVIDELMKAFPNIAVKIDGSVSLTQRQAAVDAFQNNDKIRLFVGNIQAAGVGITLTAASNVAFLELPWTPGALVQAEDRCHRIGQKSVVNIHYLLAAGTIEERIARLIDSKRQILDTLLDGQFTAEESLLLTLIKSYQDDKQ